MEVSAAPCGQSHLPSPPLGASCLSGVSGLGQGVEDQAVQTQGWQAMTRSKPATVVVGVAFILQLLMTHWWELYYLNNKQQIASQWVRP